MGQESLTRFEPKKKRKKTTKAKVRKKIDRPQAKIIANNKSQQIPPHPGKRKEACNNKKNQLLLKK
jgi:hypothetical protein